MQIKPTIVIDPRTPKMSEVNQNIQVFVRSRPLNNGEKKGSVEILPEKRCIQMHNNKVFSFDNVFSPQATQLDVYRAVVEPLVSQVIEGYNCTVFAYGQTGTGKTYTMIGNHTDKEVSWNEDPYSGIIPRAIDQLLDELKCAETEYTLRVSFLELYNEDAYDLLSPLSDTSKLRIYNDSERKGSVIISGLVELIVQTKAEIFEILKKGSLKRQTAPTLMNACSSRSHSIFSITVHIKEITFDGSECVKLGKLNLVDLAGSENIGRSGAVEERAREASNINKSLLTLGRVITSLVEKTQHIPYRDSKLTRLLQDSLGGKTKTSIIATISPCLDDSEDTLSTLEYAQRAKKITNKPEINLKMSKKTLINEYVIEIDKLRRDLEAARDKKGIYVDAKNYATMEATIKKQEEDLEFNEAKLENFKQELGKFTSLLQNKEEECEQTKKELEELSIKFQQTDEILKKSQQRIENCRNLIAIYRKNEKKLVNKAKTILEVTEKCVDANEKLFNKVESYSALENNNLSSFNNLMNLYRNEFQQLNDTNSVMASTFNDGYENIKSLIEIEIERITEKNEKFQEKTKIIETEFDKFANEFLNEVKNDLKIKNDFTAKLDMLIQFYKKELINQASIFKKELVENIQSTKSILNNLMSETTKIYSNFEELIDNNILQVKEQSQNTIQRIESISNDLKLMNAKKDQEIENLKQEISLLKKENDNMDMMKKIDELYQKCNELKTEYERKVAANSNILENINEKTDSLLKKDFCGSIYFNCNELVKVVKKEENDNSKCLFMMDEQNKLNFETNIQKYEQVKKLLDSVISTCCEHQNIIENKLEETFGKLNQNSESLNVLESFNKNTKLIEEFCVKYSKELNSINCNETFEELENFLKEILEIYKHTTLVSEGMTTSQTIQLNKVNSLVEKFLQNYRKYESTGETPKRFPMSYPKTFTPITSRQLNSKSPQNIDSFIDYMSKPQVLEFSDLDDSQKENIDNNFNN